MHLNEFWALLKRNSQCNFLQGYASYEANSIKNIMTKMVLSTDVASHFKDLEVLKNITKGPVLEGKDAVVSCFLFSLSLSNCSMLVILGIRASTLTLT